MFSSVMESEQPWLSKAPLPQIGGLPDFGWRVRLDHEFKEKCSPFMIPRLHQLPELIGLSIRYTWTWYQVRKKGRKLFIDNLNLIPWQPIYGVPIGGIGCGTIGRGYRGEFCRFQMIPGMYSYNTVDANQFIVSIRRKGQTVYQQVLSPLRPSGDRLSAWNWAFDAAHAHYHGLYPRSWTRYELPGQDVVLICRQVSPVFPHDYKDTSLPAAVFVWTVENHGSSEVEVSLMFTFQNGQGDKADRAGGVWSKPFHTAASSNGSATTSGVMIHQKFRNMKCVYAIGAKHKKDVDVSHRVAFNPADSGQLIWMDLMDDGRLDSTSEPSKETKPGEELASAVCVQCSVPAGLTREAEFSLTWDMPIIHFGANEKLYTRRYTRWFGTAGDASPGLTSYALNNYSDWEKKISDWQNPILQNSQLPSWYKSALFNELYFVSDGGTVWVDPYEEKNGITQTTENLPPVIKEYGRFAYLEGHEYRMYNTYDVHHYASFALIMLWPKLQISLQYDIADSIPREQPFRVRYCMSGKMDVSKAINAVPHDVGDPDDEPWTRVNAYLIHPTQEWKDLNTKFVLQVYRDYIDTQDKEFLTDMYPAVKAVMEASLRWDVDDDGIIDNSGFPDQTYDAWSVVGASAYCGGMWLAAVRMYMEMANILGHKDDAQKFQAILTKGKCNFEKKLWNGEYYNYDSSNSNHADSVMADQLAGQWFLKASGIPDDDVFPREKVVKTLESIFKFNVLPFEGGTMGAINGMRPNGKKDMTSCQSEEFWTGVTYSVASLMFQEGIMEKGWQVGYGAYHMCYERYGLAFQTPEAYFDDRRYRSLGYMRPLCIWSMQHSLLKYQGHLLAANT